MQRPPPLPRPPFVPPSPSPASSSAAPEHDADGVLLAPPPAPRPTPEDGYQRTAKGTRRRLTPEERAQRDEHAKAIVAWRLRFAAALESVAPALADPDGPVVKSIREVAEVRPSDLAGEELLRMARPSCTGRPGSELVVRARAYDGSGPSGGFGHVYCALFTEFRDSHGNRFRTRGATIRGDEVRRVIEALSRWADGLPEDEDEPAG